MGHDPIGENGQERPAREVSGVTPRMIGPEESQDNL